MVITATNINKSLQGGSAETSAVSRRYANRTLCLNERLPLCGQSRRTQPRHVLDTAASNAYVPNDVGSKSHNELTWNHVVSVFTFFGLLMTALVSLSCWSHFSYRRRLYQMDCPKCKNSPYKGQIPRTEAERKKYAYTGGYFRTCPTCSGKGTVDSPKSVAKVNPAVTEVAKVNPAVTDVRVSNCGTAAANGLYRFLKGGTLSRYGGNTKRVTYKKDDGHTIINDAGFWYLRNADGKLLYFADPPNRFGWKAPHNRVPPFTAEFWNTGGKSTAKPTLSIETVAPAMPWEVEAARKAEQQKAARKAAEQDRLAAEKAAKKREEAARKAAAPRKAVSMPRKIHIKDDTNDYGDYRLIKEDEIKSCNVSETLRKYCNKHTVIYVKADVPEPLSSRNGYMFAYQGIGKWTLKKFTDKYDREFGRRIISSVRIKGTKECSIEDPLTDLPFEVPCYPFTEARKKEYQATISIRCTKPKCTGIYRNRKCQKCNSDKTPYTTVQY